MSKKREGETLLCDPVSNVLAVRIADGVPRTIFRPKKRLDYFNAQ